MTSGAAAEGSSTLAAGWPDWPEGSSAAAPAPALPSPSEYFGLRETPKDETLAAWCPELKDLPAGGAVKFTDLLRGLPPRDMRPPMSELARLGSAQLSRFELRQDGHKPPPPPEPEPPKVSHTDNIMACAIALFDGKPAHVHPGDWLTTDPRTVPRKALPGELLKVVDTLQRWRAAYPECDEIFGLLLTALQNYKEKRDQRKLLAGAKRPHPGA